MNIFGIHFHSWQDIQTETTACFLGEKYQKFNNTGLRICRKCKIVQEYTYDSQGGFWFQLSKDKQDIINKHIYYLSGRHIIEKDPYSLSWCEEVENKI